MIEDAKTVDVWKTRGNTIKTLDVIETGSQKSQKKKKYSKLLTDSARTGQNRDGMKVINVGDGLDGLIILRKPQQSTSHSRMTLIEEINPRSLRLRGEDVVEPGSEGSRSSRRTREEI